MQVPVWVRVCKSHVDVVLDKTYPHPYSSAHDTLAQFRCLNDVNVGNGDEATVAEGRVVGLPPSCRSRVSEVYLPLQLECLVL